jgi:hypothetical protein
MLKCFALKQLKTVKKMLTYYYCTIIHGKPMGRKNFRPGNPTHSSATRNERRGRRRKEEEEEEEEGRGGGRRRMLSCAAGR